MKSDVEENPLHPSSSTTSPSSTVVGEGREGGCCGVVGVHVGDGDGDCDGDGDGD